MATQKLLVANRGEIACRVIRAAASLGIQTVSVYSDVDSGLPHVAMADESFHIGPARASESYLNSARLLQVAKDTGATLLHPGYGFLSENSSFAEMCRAQGVTFVGPTPETIDLMGDKEQARRTAAQAGVPILQGTDKLGDDFTAINRAARDIGYPLLVKAAAGGGGIGMRIVRTAEELEGAVQSTRTLAHKAFGDGSVFLERYVEKARHVEIQVFGFGDGSAIHLFERDCSLQRRHQKVIEEARAPELPSSVSARIAEAAVRLVSECRYQGAGTVEFLVDAASHEFYFLEMNTRIQVEHPVTEMITGTDLVAAQIRLASGESLRDEFSQQNILARGHAIEARVYAENPTKNFLPSPGPLSVFEFPTMDGIRIDCGYAQGTAVTPYYDPMVMKVIAHGTTRESAVERLHDALGAIRIEGITHNIPYLRACLRHGDFAAGDVYTGFLGDRHAQLIRQ